MKTAELTGAALDWAVAKCEGIDTFPYALPGGFALYAPSTAWKDGGPIIEREKLDFEWVTSDCCRASYNWLDEDFFEGFGPTPLIATMRCYVAIKLGDEVEIPEELMP